MTNPSRCLALRAADGRSWQIELRTLSRSSAPISTTVYSPKTGYTYCQKHERHVPSVRLQLRQPLSWTKKCSWSSRRKARADAKLDIDHNVRLHERWDAAVRHTLMLGGNLPVFG